MLNVLGGDGFEVYYKKDSVISNTLAKNIEKEIVGLGQNSRGLKTKINSEGNDYFGFLREIRCPSVLVEGLFVDNIEDIKIANTVKKQMDFGYAYARGIIKTLITLGKIIEPDTKANNVINLEEIAREVIAGKWGNGIIREKKLKIAGYEYKQVQEKVNEILSAQYNNKNKSVEEIAREVIAGKWGNGKLRRRRLTEAGFDYNKIQSEVNKILYQNKK